MKIKKLTSVILAAMMTATVVPFNEVSAPYNNFASYAVEAESEESYEQEIVAEGVCGENLTWTIYDYEKLLIISGEGAMTNWESSDATPWAEYNDYIEAVRIDEGVTEIGENSFNALPEDCLFFFYNYECIIPDSNTALPPKANISCYKNSAAEEYAIKYGKEFSLVMGPGLSSIADGECGKNLYWIIYDNMIIEIVGEGEMDSWENPYDTPWTDYANDFTTAIIEEDVTKISENAFASLDNLEAVVFNEYSCEIPDSAAAIPENVIIYGYAGSTAEEYAINYGRQFINMGGNYFEQQPITTGGECGENVSWNTDGLGTIYFEGNGKMDEWESPDDTPWNFMSDSIKHAVFSEEVTNISKNVLSNCFELDVIIRNPECEIADNPDLFGYSFAVITGYEGSTAQAHAEKYGLEFVDITSGEQEIVAEGVCGENLTWVLDDNGSLVFSGEGDMDNWASAEDTPWAEYTSMIRTVSMSEEVTSIGDYAFYGCENLVTGALTSVIGAHAYEGCKRMNGYSYYGEVSPINEIKDCAFKGCYTLWAIPIANPDCIIADSEDVFDNNTAIMGYAGSTAQEYAEKYERDFQDITLINSEGECGENLNWYMTSDGMLGIGGSGEMDNYSEDITAAPWYSFAEDITSICINDFNSDDDAITLSENCFAMCENAETIHFYDSNCIIADSAETIPENAVIWGYAGSTAQEYAEKYNREFEAIPTTDASGTLNEEFTWELNSEGILYITGFGAMDDYTDGNPWGEYADMITSVYFYGNVTSIGKNAFSYCENLEFVDIDESIEFIDEDAFSGCNNLIELNFHGNKKCVIFDSASTIPAQAELIGHYGSPLHEYAKKYDRTFYWIDGDVNGDSTVDSSDASMVLAEYANIQTGGEANFSSTETTTADVTNDEIVDAADASAILRYYSKASTGGKPTWD